MIKFTVKFIPDREPQRQLSGLGMRRVNRALGMKFREITLRNFGMSGAYRASVWPPYARNYPQWGKKKGSPATLIRTGKLMQSIRVDSNNNSYAEVYSEGLPYSDRHQFGRAPVPARPYYPIVSSGVGTERFTPYAQSELEQTAVRELEFIVNAK